MSSETPMPIMKNKKNYKLLPTINSSSNASIRPIKSSFNVISVRKKDVSPSDLNVYANKPGKLDAEFKQVR